MQTNSIAAVGSLLAMMFDTCEPSVELADKILSAKGLIQKRD